MEITSEELERFERDGVIRIASVVPRELLERLDRAIDPYLARWKSLRKLVFGDTQFFTRPNVWKIDPFFFGFVQEPVFLEIAAQLLRSKRISLLQDQIFVKLVGCRKPFGWHQDHAYAPIAGDKMVSFWMATERITLESGGLQFVAGSHRWTEAFTARPELTPVEKLLRRRRSADTPVESLAEYSEDRVVAFELEPGDLVAFHGRTLHRSPPNLSQATQRKGWAVRYVGDDVTYRPQPEVGPTFEFWDPELAPGEAMEGPLFPLLYEDGRFLAREFRGPERMQLSRILRTPLRSFWSAVSGAAQR